MQQSEKATEKVQRNSNIKTGKKFYITNTLYINKNLNRSVSKSKINFQTDILPKVLQNSINVKTFYMKRGLSIQNKDNDN